MQILRLHLGSIHVIDTPWPVHGFLVLHPSLGAVVIDTGCGGPEPLMRDFRVVNRTIADALAEHDVSPADVQLLVNTHLHFDHCGQNPSFPHARMVVQRAEYERVQREDADIHRWLDASGVKFELVDGDIALADDLRLVTTPGHTAGHQSVLATTDAGTEVFVGDAVFTRRIWDGSISELPRLQADDEQAWRRSLDALHALVPAAVHFCHDT